MFADKNKNRTRQNKQTQKLDKTCKKTTKPRASTNFHPILNWRIGSESTHDSASSHILYLLAQDIIQILNYPRMQYVVVTFWFRTNFSWSTKYLTPVPKDNGYGKKHSYAQILLAFSNLRLGENPSNRCEDRGFLTRFSQHFGRFLPYRKSENGNRFHA